jgi:hypothetical protein
MGENICKSCDKELKSEINNELKLKGKTTAISFGNK